MQKVSEGYGDGRVGEERVKLKSGVLPQIQ